LPADRHRRTADAYPARLFDQFLRQAPAESGLYACAKLLLYPLVAYLIAKQRLRRRLDLSPA
jgi:ABC-2 type transport system permease protein